MVVADQFSAGLADALQPLFFAAFCAVPIAFLAGILRSRLSRSSVGDLVVALQEGVPLRDALARALGDPSLEIAYWLDGRQRWVNVEGRGLPDPAAVSPRAATFVERDGKRIAALIHDAWLAEEHELVSAVAAAAGLSLQNERLQAELRAQFNFLETIVNTAPALLNTVDTEGRIVNFNKAVEVASGHDDPEQIRFKYFWEVFIDPPEREDVIARFEAAKPDFAPAEYENVFTNARGEKRVIEWRTAPVHDESGEVVSIIAGGVEITERKARELELQRQRDFAQQINDTIPSFLIAMDHEAVIVDHGVNLAFMNRFGWQVTELDGRSFLGVIAPVDDHAARMAIANAANGVAQPEQESHWLCRDGTLRVVEWTAIPITDELGRELVLVSGADVTERKSQEEEIRASRSRIAAAADEAPRKLERNLHDGAQQRLVSLSLTLRLAEAKLHGDPDEAGKLLDAARQELALALDELRELARGIHPAVLTDRGLAAAIEALVARAPFPVEIEVPEQRLPAAVEAAAYYVVSEALANVAKYAGASSAHVRVRETDELVTVEVVDNGDGGADPDKGSGLRGLADRVAVLDGTLHVASHPGAGTLVHAEIPVRRAVLSK